MTELVELALVLAVGALAGCWVVFTRLQQKINELEAKVDLFSRTQGEIDPALKQDLGELLQEIERASLTAALRFKEHADFLNELRGPAQTQFIDPEPLQDSAGEPKIETGLPPVIETGADDPEPVMAGSRPDVLALAQQGRNAGEIAREIGVSRSEVDLLLQMNRKPRK